MTIKPNGHNFIIKEQIIRDPVSGLTFQFECMPDTDAPYRMKVFGELPHGNREILFDIEGQEAGAGTALNSTCSANWVKKIN